MARLNRTRREFTAFQFQIISLIAACLFSTLQGCASLLPSAGKPADAVTEGNAPGAPRKDEAVAQVIDSDGNREEGQSPEDIENLTIEEVIRIEEPNTQNLYDNSRYDFPITMNSRVEGWIDYFTGRGRPHMERYLGRSSRYIPLMKQILKKSGMPEDLVYLALIESGFNLKAKSRAKAVGPWQFMKATGQRYGLRVDAWLDERRDPVRSTGAAARYLKDLYLMFESWYLAASAYNAGEYKILRAIEELKTNNYWRICETSFLRRETKDYIPKLIAAAIIAKNPTRYGFDEIAYMDPLEFDIITVDFPMHLRDIAKVVDAREEDLEDLNPELRRNMVPPNTTYELRIPSGSKVIAERGLAAVRNKLIKADLPLQHVVQSGETLASVSRKYRVRTSDLANANSLGAKEKLQPGSSLVIPRKGEFRPASTEEKRTTTKTKRTVSATTPSGGYITHAVKRGESLWSIAEKYNVTVQDIFRWNNLRKSRIQTGLKLKIKSSAVAENDES